MAAMIIRGIEDLPVLKELGERIIKENKLRYMTDFASGILDDLRRKHIAYSGGGVMRNEQGMIIFGRTIDELFEQLPKDKIYFLVQVGVVNVVPDRQDRGYNHRD